MLDGKKVNQAADDNGRYQYHSKSFPENPAEKGISADEILYCKNSETKNERQTVKRIIARNSEVFQRFSQMILKVVKRNICA